MSVLVMHHITSVVIQRPCEAHMVTSQTTRLHYATPTHLPLPSAVLHRMPARPEGKVRLRLRGFRKYFDREVSKDDAKLRRQLVLLNSEVSTLRHPDSSSLVVTTGSASTSRPTRTTLSCGGGAGPFSTRARERQLSGSSSIPSSLPCSDHRMLSAMRVPWMIAVPHTRLPCGGLPACPGASDPRLLPGQGRLRQGESANTPRSKQWHGACPVCKKRPDGLST